MVGFICVLLIGCGASTKSYLSPKVQKLNQYKNVYVTLGSTSGDVSASSVGMGSLSNSAQTNSTGSALTQGSVQNLGGTYIPFNANTQLNTNSNTTIGGTSSQLGVTHVYRGDKQANIALEKFVFKLREIGFNVVNNPSKSDAIVFLSIGQIRYDPITGWIADQGSVQIMNTKTEETIAHYIADTRFVTPMIETIIKNLSKKIRKDF